MRRLLRRTSEANRLAYIRARQYVQKNRHAKQSPQAQDKEEPLPTRTVPPASAPWPLPGAPSNQNPAIVVGAGISGGWAAEELCEKGMKTLLLERGRNVEHQKDYITEHEPP